MVLLWFSYCFIMVFPYFPISSSDFPYLFLWCCNGFPVVFLWFLYGFTMVFLWFSCSFLYNLTRFSNMEVWPVGSETAFVGTKAASSKSSIAPIRFEVNGRKNFLILENSLISICQPKFFCFLNNATLSSTPFTRPTVCFS